MLKYWYKGFASLSLSSYTCSTKVTMQKSCRVIPAALHYLTCSAQHNNNLATAVEFARMRRTLHTPSPALPPMDCWSYSFLSCKTQTPKMNKLRLSSSSWYLEKFKNVPRGRGTSALVPVLTLLTHTSQRIEALICKQISALRLYVCFGGWGEKTDSKYY